MSASNMRISTSSSTTRSLACLAGCASVVTFTPRLEPARGGSLRCVAAALGRHQPGNHSADLGVESDDGSSSLQEMRRAYGYGGRYSSSGQRGGPACFSVP